MANEKQKCNNKTKSLLVCLPPLNNNTNNNCFGEGHKSIQQVQQINQQNYQQNFQQNSHLSVAKKKYTKLVNSLFPLTPVLFGWQQNLSVLIKVRRVHYGEMGKAPTKFM